MRTLVEFKAGKMEWDGKMVTPDKRKGKLSLMQDGTEDMAHVVWTDREKNTKDGEWVIVKDAYLERVGKCTTGRVYVLKYLSSKIRLFFWMQEPKEDADAELIKKFNDGIGAEIPKKAAVANSAAGVAGATGSSSSSSTAAGGMSQDALQQQLLRMLQGAGNQMQNQQKFRVSLNHVLKTDKLMSLAEDGEALSELRGHMPAEQKEDQDVVESLQSPQLKQNMSVLTQAIYSDQLPLLWTMMGLPGGPTPGEDPMESLCKALEQKYKK